MLSKKLRRERRRELNRKCFPSERWFEKQLKKRNIGHYERNFCLEKRFFGDFVWPKKKLVVEIDGSSHAGKEEYDRARDTFLAKRGWKVIRVQYPSGDLERFFNDWGSKLPEVKPPAPPIHNPQNHPPKKKEMPILKAICQERNKKALEDLERRHREFDKIVRDRNEKEKSKSKARPQKGNGKVRHHVQQGRVARDSRDDCTK